MFPKKTCTFAAASSLLAVALSGCMPVRTTSLEGSSRLKILALDTKAELEREFGMADAETTDGRYVLYSLAKEANWYWVTLTSSAVDDLGSNDVGATHVLFEFDLANRNIATRFNHCGEDARSAVCSLDSMGILYAMIDELHGPEEANRQRELEATHAALADAMHSAAAAGDVDKIDDLIAQGASRTAHRDGLTPLHRAAIAGQTEIVSYLVENGVPVDSLTVRTAQSALHLAAANGRIETLRSLLAAGAQIDLADQDDHTPLRDAVSASQTEAAMLLMDHGADVNAKPDDILLIAIDNGDIGLIRAILDHGADPNKRVRIRGLGKVTPSERASRSGSAETLALLERYGARS